MRENVILLKWMTAPKSRQCREWQSKSLRKYFAKYTHINIRIHPNRKAKRIRSKVHQYWLKPILVLRVRLCNFTFYHFRTVFFNCYFYYLLIVWNFYRSIFSAQEKVHKALIHRIFYGFSFIGKELILIFNETTRFFVAFYLI